MPRCMRHTCPCCQGWRANHSAMSEHLAAVSTQLKQTSQTNLVASEVLAAIARAVVVANPVPNQAS